MKNVTVTMEDSVADWARMEAARRNTSVSRLVGELLAEKMRHDDAYERAMREALAPAMQQATVLGAERGQVAAWLEGPGDPAAGSPGTAPGTPPGTTPAGIDHWLYLVDPMGRLMMRFPADGNPSGIKRDLERVMRTHYRIDDFQQTYFVLQHLGELLELARIDFAPIYARVTALAEIDPGDTVPGDRLVSLGTGAYHAARPR